MEKSGHDPYRTAMVALDLSQMDDDLIRYAAIIAEILQLECVLFIHVARSLALPKDLLEEYPDLLEPLGKSIETSLNSKIKVYFGDSEMDVQCIVKEGQPIDEILKLSTIKNVDLIIMGRKNNLEGSGIVSSKIAGKSPCSLLFVTPEYNLTISKLLVPIDFSHHSAMAVELALEISEVDHSTIETIHFYGVPLGYNKTGKSYNEFAGIMKKIAKNDFGAFLKKHSLSPGLSCEYVLSEYGKYPERTYDYAEKNDVDLIVIGSRGRTDISSLVMGSVAEKLVYLDGEIPVLIVKEKGENMGFLEALMNI